MKKTIATILLLIMMTSAVSGSVCESEGIKKQIKPIGLLSAYTLKEFDSSDYGRALLTFLMCYSVNMLADGTVRMNMTDLDNVYKISVVDDETAVALVYTKESHMMIYYTPNYDQSFVLFYGHPDADNNSEGVNAMLGGMYTIKQEDFTAAKEAFLEYISYISNQK